VVDRRATVEAGAVHVTSTPPVTTAAAHEAGALGTVTAAAACGAEVTVTPAIARPRTEAPTSESLRELFIGGAFPESFREDVAVKAFWGAFVLAAVLVALLMSWPDITGHRLNGQPCGQPPAAAHGGLGDESDCHFYGDDRPSWCC
jgi:hypothetical protein